MTVSAVLFNYTNLANVRRSLLDLYAFVNVFEVDSTVTEMRRGPEILKVGKITCPLRHVSDLILHLVFVSTLYSQSVFQIGSF